MVGKNVKSNFAKSLADYRPKITSATLTDLWPKIGSATLACALRMVITWPFFIHFLQRNTLKIWFLAPFLLHGQCCTYGLKTTLKLVVHVLAIMANSYLKISGVTKKKVMQKCLFVVILLQNKTSFSAKIYLLCLLTFMLC